MSTFRRVVAAVGFLAAALFGAAFVASFVSPALVEGTARAILLAEVQQRVHERVAALDGRHIESLARRISDQNAAAAARLRRQMLDDLPGKVARVVGEMRALDCECRRQIERTAAGGWEWRITEFARAGERLAALIRTRYIEAAERLTHEVRVFTAANGAVWLLLGLAATVRRRADVHLMPAAVVLLAASVLVAYLYLFQQDWLRTIVFDRHVGLWYFAHLGLAFAVLGDVVLNRARVTARALSAMLRVAGSGIEVAPC